VSAPGVFNVWDAAGLAGATALGAGYAVGLTRLWRHAGARKGLPTWSVVAAAGGWLGLVAGLGPPLALLADLSFAAHMGQHEMLMLVAAPLLALGQPLLALLWALPPRARTRVGAWAHRPRVVAAWHRLTAPIAVLLLQLVVLAAWHWPPAFELALRHDGIHAVQHLMFFLVAALFWWSLVHGRFGRLGYGAGVLVVFVTATYCGLLGAFFVVAPHALYPTHAMRDMARHVDPLADQQLAGLLMWVPAGVVLLAGALALFAAWLGASGRRAEHGTAGRVLRDLQREQAILDADASARAAATRALLVAIALAPLALPLAGCLHRELATVSRAVGNPDRGKQLIAAYGCNACHMVPGVPGGRVVAGPPLVDLRLRVVIAGRLPASPEALAHFIRFPQEDTPGTAMPDLAVSAHDARDIAAYLYDMP